MTPEEPTTPAGTDATCPCGIASLQPWKTRDAPFSPASVVGGVLILAVAAAIFAFAPKGNVIGLVLLGIWGAATVVWWVAQAARGHRGLCLVNRGVWLGIATVGLPVRVVGALSF